MSDHSHSIPPADHDPYWGHRLAADVIVKELGAYDDPLIALGVAMNFLAAGILADSSPDLLSTRAFVASIIERLELIADQVEEGHRVLAAAIKAAYIADPRSAYTQAALREAVEEARRRLDEWQAP